MAAAVTDRTKVILLCTPNNPTGVPIIHDRLEAFLQSVRSDVLVVIDEAYAEYADAGSGPDSLGFYRRYPNVRILRTFSKATDSPACASGSKFRRRQSPTALPRHNSRQRFISPAVRSASRFRRSPCMVRGWIESKGNRVKGHEFCCPGEFRSKSLRTTSRTAMTSVDNSDDSLATHLLYWSGFAELAPPITRAPPEPPTLITAK